MKKNANNENNVILHDDEFYYDVLRKNLKPCHLYYNFIKSGFVLLTVQ